MSEPIITFDAQTAQDLLDLVQQSRSGPRTGRSHQTAPPREWVPRPDTFRNDSGETAPAYAVLRVTGAVIDNNRPLITIDKPDASTDGVYVINGPRDVESGKKGQCRLSGAMKVLYDTGTPAVGETWGPKADQWELSKDKPGFVVLGVLDDVAKLMLVVPSPPRNATRCNATLAEDYTSGSGTVKVNNVVPLDGASPVESETDELEVTVVRDIWPSAVEGTTCEIIYNETQSRWELDRLDVATRCRAKLQAAYASGSTTATVDNISGMNGTSPVASAGDTLTANLNMSGWPSFAVGTDCNIEWDKSAAAWSVYWIALNVTGLVAANEQILTHGANSVLAWVDVDTEECP